MATGFNRDEVAALLVRCHRRCCICHRFCGTKIETDHIVPAAESHDHSIENAIPVCFDCHAEIHAYNPKHPRGRCFTPEELRMSKEKWLHICETRPEIFVEASRTVDIGPIQGMLDELEHNLVVSAEINGEKSGFPQLPMAKEVWLGFLFKDKQFTRAIREGVLSTLDDSLRQAISKAYGAVSRANEAVKSHYRRNSKELYFGFETQRAMDAIKQAIPLIKEAREQLLKFVGSEEPNS